MKQEITAHVAMLPFNLTDGFYPEGTLFKSKLYNGRVTAYWDSKLHYTSMEKDEAQHLYFTTDEPILHNDCILEQSEWGIKSVCRSIGNWNKGDYIKYPNDKKIIASTDPTLGLPTIPLTWIKDVYVRSNGTIMTVRLELEFNHALKSMATESRIKLTPNNEVVIVDEPHTIYTHPEENADRLDKISNLLDKMNNIIDKKPTSDKELEMAAEQYTAGNSLEYAYMQEIPAFKAGAEWQKQQSATDDIEFAIWTHENKWTTINKEPLWYNKDRYYQYQDKTECLTSQQLYKLYQQTKKQ